MKEEVPLIPKWGELFLWQLNWLNYDDLKFLHKTKVIGTLGRYGVNERGSSAHSKMGRTMSVALKLQEL